LLENLFGDGVHFNDDGNLRLINLSKYQLLFFCGLLQAMALYIL